MLIGMAPVLEKNKDEDSLGLRNAKLGHIGVGEVNSLLLKNLDSLGGLERCFCMCNTVKC